MLSYWRLLLASWIAWSETWKTWNFFHEDVSTFELPIQSFITQVSNGNCNTGWWWIDVPHEPGHRPQSWILYHSAKSYFAGPHPLTSADSTAAHFFTVPPPRPLSKPTSSSLRSKSSSTLPLLIQPMTFVLSYVWSQRSIISIIISMRLLTGSWSTVAIIRWSSTYYIVT